MNKTLNNNNDSIDSENIGKLTYSLIQKKYWDVSFLSQYSLKHLDRIIMALPMIIISFYLIVKVSKSFELKNLLKLKLQKIFNHEDIDLNIYENFACLHSDNNKEENEKEEKIQKNFIHLREIFYLFSFVNFFVNFFLVVFFAHPQIINRVITCNPLLYFFFADKIFEFINKKNKVGKYVLISFLILGVVGCVMYPGVYGFA